MRTKSLRVMCAGLLALALAGCQSSGLLKRKKCEDCASGTCERHPAPVDQSTTPSQQPFAPFSVTK
jgi:hypothetical protein